MDYSSPAVEGRLGRRFLAVWFGQTVSAIGSSLSGVGVAVYVFIESGSAAWLGVLAALASLPFLAAAPLLKWTDRFPRRSVMIVSDTFAVVGPVFALSMALAGSLELWHLGVSAVLSGIGSAFQVPAAQAAVPELVAPEALARANGLNQLGPALGIVLGPVLATPLVAWWGIEAVLIVDVITFLIAVVATLSVRFDAVAPADNGQEVDDGSWTALRLWLRGPGRPFIALLATMAAVNFFLAFFNISILVMATSSGGVAASGLVLGAAGIAMIAGSLVSATRGVPDDRVGVFALGLLIVGAGFVVASSHPSLVVLIVGIVGALWFVPLVNAAVSTLYHEGVPASMHGRMFGVRATLGTALEPLGSVISGFVVAHLAEPALRENGSLADSVGRVIGTGDGRGAALVMAAVGTIMVAMGLLVRRSSLREVFRPNHESGVEELGLGDPVTLSDNR